MSENALSAAEVPETGRRQQILREAARLFADRGVATTSIRDIADAVGLRSASLYHHFAAKEQMVHEILSQPVDELLAAYAEVLGRDESPRTCLTGLIEASFEILLRLPDACAIYQNDYAVLSRQPGFDYLKAAHGRFQAIWLRILKDGIAAGQFRADIEPFIFYRLSRDAIWQCVGPFRRGEIDEAEIRRLAPAFTDLLLNGFSLRP